MELTEYIHTNRDEIISRVERTTPILLPNSETPPDIPSKRTPYDGQARVIEAARRVLREKKAVFVIGEMGTGKTLIGSLIPKPGSKILVLAPGHLVDKWKREIETTRPGASAWIVKNIQDCQRLLNTDPVGSDTHWYILSKETAKLSYLWKPAARIKRIDAWIYNSAIGTKELQSIDSVHCPDCYREITTTDSRGNEHLVCKQQLEKHKRYCHHCNAPLWTADRTRNRKIALSDYLKKKHARFDYLIIDEVHEFKAADSAQGNALGALAAISDKRILLTGTLIGGYATHLYYLLWRVLPRMMKRLSFDYKNPRPFIAQYGVRELVVREYISDSASNRQSKGSSKNQTWNERPGISPQLFTDFLLSNGIYLQLDDLSASLPPLYEQPIALDMDSEQATGYQVLERELRSALAPELARGNRRNLSKMLVNLLAWPDSPWDNTFINLGETASIQCPNISNTGPTAKERQLIEIAEEARDRGSKTLVYCQFTSSRDIMPRLQMILEQHGLKTAILRSTVKPEKREQWIIDNAPDTDCLICNPEIVKTGLDLYDYTTIVFFQTGYNTFTIRQASRRSWRLGQTQECRIYYLYYSDTMQHRAIELVAKKLNSATALDGKLSSEGLNAMADDDDAFALAKALMEGLSMDAQIQFGTPRPKDAPPAEPAPAPAPLPEILTDTETPTHWIPETTTAPDTTDSETWTRTETVTETVEIPGLAPIECKDITYTLEPTYTADMPAWTPTADEIEFDVLSFFHNNKRRTIDREKIFNFYKPHGQIDRHASTKLKTAIITTLDQIITQRGLIEYKNSGNTIAVNKAAPDSTAWINRYYELRTTVKNYRIKMTKVYIMAQLQDAALNLNALYSDTLHAAINDEIETYLLAIEELLAEKQIVKAPIKISDKIVYTTTENYYSTIDRDRMDQIIQIITQRPETAGFIMQQLTGPGTMPYICRLLDQLSDEQRIVGYTDHDNEFRYTLKARVEFVALPELTKSRSAILPLPEKAQPEIQPEPDIISYSDTWTKKIDQDRAAGIYDIYSCIIDILRANPDQEFTAASMTQTLKSVFPLATVNTESTQEAIDTLRHNKKITSRTVSYRKWYKVSKNWTPPPLTDEERANIEALKKQTTQIITTQTGPAASTETKSPLDILTEKITDTLATTPGRTADELAEKLSDDRTNILAALLCLETEGKTKQHTTDKKRFYLSGQDTPAAPAPQDTSGTISNLEHYRRIKQDRSAKKPTNRTKTRNDGQLSLFG